MNANILEKELLRYKDELDHLLTANENKFAVIKGDEAIECFDTYDDALKAGYDKYGLEPFLVKQVIRVPVVMNFTRFSISACQ